MLSRDCIHELHSMWLPNITDAGLDRLIELLETASPLLIHGCFTRSLPMGCLATHAAWHHPRTTHLNHDAGIRWLHTIAGLNPATSRVIHDWDRCGAQLRNARRLPGRVPRRTPQAQEQNASVEEPANLLEVC